MKRATWHGATLAQSNDIETVENNAYFPANSVARAHLRASNHTTTCPWKGTAHYYDVVVGDAVNPNAAWYYPEPKEAAAAIAGRVAFWKGVVIAD